MLKFYYNRISLNARRVWVALLEKKLQFELIEVPLDGSQFQPDFLAINPFHHIPVIIDEEFTVFESLAILDYLEAKYPQPTLLPNESRSLAIVKMIEMVTMNELLPATLPLMRQMLELAIEKEKVAQAKQKIATVMNFLETQLNEDSSYFLGEKFTLAEIVAGTAVPSLPLFGISLNEYPKLQKWCDRLQQRESWRQTTPSLAEIEAFKPIMKNILEKL
ncbi:MAG: glutathione S-transferase family protein [Oscillatoria sp. PMC 1068.18]|nr:glutathione S-transferase family protein [Oscillatoria sp. PMC 1076.18]MEC4991258.1 glutathione S-transferase family protein [Oscillatoria sp. PMC 1068.18]